MKEEKKTKLKKILKCTGIALGGAGIMYLVCKYLPDPVEKDENCTEYERGYHNALVDMVDYCEKNGESVVIERRDSQDKPYLVANLVSEKPENAVDYPYLMF